MPSRNSHNDVPHAFSRGTVVLLVKSGWSREHRGPVDLYEAAYRKEGLEFVRVAKRFLDRFGGLTIHYKTKTRQEDVLDFRAERAALGSGEGALAGYEELAGERPLCPIGSYFLGHNMLLMDRKGRVFGGTEWSILFIGKSGEEAIEKILTGAPVETVKSDVIDEAGRLRQEKSQAGAKKGTG
jgi:SUKH-3 immunity protein